MSSLACRGLGLVSAPVPPSHARRVSSGCLWLASACIVAPSRASLSLGVPEGCLLRDVVWFAVCTCGRSCSPGGWLPRSGLGGWGERCSEGCDTWASAPLNHCGHGFASLMYLFGGPPKIEIEKRRRNSMMADGPKGYHGPKPYSLLRTLCLGPHPPAEQRNSPAAGCERRVRDRASIPPVVPLVLNYGPCRRRCARRRAWGASLLLRRRGRRRREAESVRSFSGI